MQANIKQGDTVKAKVGTYLQKFTGNKHFPVNEICGEYAVIDGIYFGELNRLIRLELLEKVH